MRIKVSTATLIIVAATSGCARVAGTDGCSRLKPLVTAHAAALAVDGGPQSLATGRALIATDDARCGR